MLKCKFYSKGAVKATIKPIKIKKKDINKEGKLKVNGIWPKNSIKEKIINETITNQVRWLAFLNK